MAVYKTPQYPTNLMFIDTETKPGKGSVKGELERHWLWFGVALRFRREGGKRTRECIKGFTKVKEFWDFLITCLDKNRPLWVFAHNLCFDLTILDCWTQADKYGIEVDLPVLDDPPNFICCTHEKGKVNFVDTFNYWKCSVEELGKQQGLKKLPMPKTDELNESWWKYCTRDVEVIAKAVENLIQWLQANDLGPLSYTIASIALGTFKHRFMKINTIHVHDNADLLALERASYHGGLTHPYFIGSVKEKVWNLDVNSLYPFVMLNKYPIQPYMSMNHCKPSALYCQMDKQGAVAQVRIESKSTPYPLYKDGRLLEAVGDYWSVLCGAELKQALELGHVREVRRCHLYHMDYIFNDYVDYFYKQRMTYARNKDDIGKTFCKLMLNSLYGKFGQRSFSWQDLTYDVLHSLYEARGLQMPEKYEKEDCLPSFAIGINHWIPENYPEPLTVRLVGGALQVRLLQGEHHESCPIIAAYVTSYARHFMRSLHNIAGKGNSYYTDTDSLFVNRRGYRNLLKNNRINAVMLGGLKIQGVDDCFTVFGPKDYIFAGSRTAKGIRKNAEPVCPLCHTPLNKKGICPQHWVKPGEHTAFRQLQFEGIRGVLRRGPRPTIDIVNVVKTLHREYKKGTITPSGWTEYPVIQGDSSMLEL